METITLLHNIITNLYKSTELTDPIGFIQKNMDVSKLYEINDESEKEQKDVYNVKYNSMLIYLLADLTLQNIINFDMIIELLIRYCNLEKHLMLNNMYRDEYPIDKINNPEETNPFSLENNAVMASYRLLTYVKIAELIVRKKRMEFISVYGDFFYSTLHPLITNTIIDIFIILDEDNINVTNNINHYELRMMLVALNKVDDFTEDPLYENEICKYFDQKNSNTTTIKNNAYLSIRNISLFVDKMIVTVNNILEKIDHSQKVSDKSILIPLIYMSDEEIEMADYYKDKYITIVSEYLNNCCDNHSLYVKKSDSYIGLIGTDEIDIILEMLVYSKIYKTVNFIKPLANGNNYHPLKQNIITLINRFDVNMCFEGKYNVTHDKQNNDIHFSSKKYISYLVPISIIYARIIVLMSCFELEYTKLTDQKENVYTSIDILNGRNNDVNEETYPLLPSFDQNKTLFDILDSLHSLYFYDWNNNPLYKNQTNFVPKYGSANNFIEKIKQIDIPFPKETENKPIECDFKLCRCHEENLDEESYNKYLTEFDEKLKTKNVITINDLIELGKTYDCRTRKQFNQLDLKKIADLTESLENFNKMKGVEDIKQKIINNVLYFLKYGKNKGQILNIAIYGPPGVGKTTIAKHLANIYAKTGILSTNKVLSVKRSDLIGKYLGETAMKTQEVINKIKGGILLIDEAYSLGHDEKRDSFAKECLDTLTHNLGQEDTDFICIVAGYEDDVKKCFFGQNKGLQRRFPFVYKIDNYEDRVMAELMFSKLNTNGWKLNNEDNNLDILTAFIKKNKERFENFMGDIENFVLRMEIIYNSENVFRDQSNKIITHELLQKTLYDIYNTDEEKEKKQKKENEWWRSLYV